MYDRGKGELVAVVQEYHEISLLQLLNSSSDSQIVDTSTKQIIFDIACGLRYLPSKGIGKYRPRATFLPHLTYIASCLFVSLCCVNNTRCLVRYFQRVFILLECRLQGYIRKKLEGVHSHGQLLHFRVYQNIQH